MTELKKHSSGGLNGKHTSMKEIYQNTVGFKVMHSGKILTNRECTHPLHVMLDLILKTKMALLIIRFPAVSTAVL